MTFAWAFPRCGWGRVVSFVVKLKCQCPCSDRWNIHTWGDRIWQELPRYSSLISTFRSRSTITSVWLDWDRTTILWCTRRGSSLSRLSYTCSVLRTYIILRAPSVDSFSDWIASVSGSHKQSPLTLWDLFVCRLQNRFRFSRFTDGKSSPVVSSDDRDAQQNPGESPPRERESPTPTSPVRWAQYNLTYLESTLLMHPKLIAFADDSCSRGTGADSIESCPIGFDSQSLLDNLQASGVWRG